MPHLVVAVTPDGEVVLRSNVSRDVLRSFGGDLKNNAEELKSAPQLSDTCTNRSVQKPQRIPRL